MRETLERSAAWGSRLRYVAGGILHSGGTQTSGGERIERFRCFCDTASVISPPDSTSRAGERNVGEEIERSGTSAAAPLRFSPAEFA